MSTKKVYAVVLHNLHAEELKSVIALWLKRSNDDTYYYIYAKTIVPNDTYFHMTLEHKLPNGEDSEFELQLPHYCIKAVFYSADIKKLGFV